MRAITCWGSIVPMVVLLVASAVANDPARDVLPRLDDVTRELQRDVVTIPGTTVSLELLNVPGGIFDFGVGKEAPQVVHVKPFWIGRTEVAWEQFDAFAHVRNPGVLRGADAARIPPGNMLFGFGFDGQPALAMTHRYAEAYCAWLSENTGKKYRLPTELEWEYACRAGRAIIPIMAEQLDRVAWSKENSPTNGFPDGQPHPVGKKEANEWGLHDMLGNVLEWVTTADGKLIARGGSWDHSPSRIDCSRRFPQTARWNVSDPQDPKNIWWLSDGKFVGFRVVREE